MRFTILVVLAICFEPPSYAQSKDSLLNQRSIDRPLTLFSGQLRVGFGYELGVTTRKFDDEGVRVDLRQQGISYATHSFPIDVRYGISRILQVGIRSYYRVQTQRDQMILSLSSDTYQIYQLNKKNGLEDLLISLNVRAPLKTRTWDIIAGAGIFLPVQDNKAPAPQHEVTVTNNSGGLYYTVEYNYNERWSSGVKSGFAEGALKYRALNSAITLHATYRRALQEGERVRWSHFVNNNSFSYRSESFTYLPGDILQWTSELEKQVMPWCAVSLVVAGQHINGGWQEIGDTKVSNPKQTQFTVGPGYEVLVTPKLWLRQRVWFPVSGKNISAPLTISTTIVYNTFPFQ